VIATVEAAADAEAAQARKFLKKEKIKNSICILAVASSK
jgi:hypothetical protein